VSSLVRQIAEEKSLSSAPVNDFARHAVTSSTNEPLTLVVLSSAFRAFNSIELPKLLA
jgi:hypothetical protein